MSYTNLIGVQPDFNQDCWTDDLPAGRLMIRLTASEFSNLIHYPIVVELWDKKNFGRVKRKWLSEFSESERKVASYYYGKFYRWHLISGTPQQITIYPSTISFLTRLVDFFATI